MGLALMLGRILPSLAVMAGMIQGAMVGRLGLRRNDLARAQYDAQTR